MRALYIRFSRRILRTFVMPSFLVRVFVKPPLGSFPEGGCVGMLILMRLRFTGRFSSFEKLGSGQGDDPVQLLIDRVILPFIAVQRSGGAGDAVPHLLHFDSHDLSLWLPHQTELGQILLR